MMQAIAFDLDGTLLNTPEAIVTTITTVLSEIEYGSNVDTQYLHSMIGLPLEQCFSSSMKLSPTDKQVQYAIQRYRMLFNEQVIPQAQKLLFTGVKDGLTTLHERGVKLVVATSKVYKSAYALLEAADLVRFFDLIIGSDQVTQPKPHPEMLHVILEHLGKIPANMAMVGDTTHDILMGQAAGLITIAVTYGVHTATALQKATPTYMANTFEQVVGYCLPAEYTTAHL